MTVLVTPLCPFCNKEHTRREQAIPCIKGSANAVKPFTEGDTERRLNRIDTVQYYENLPTEALDDLAVVKLVEASNSEVFGVIEWECPYIIENPHPHFDKGIPHPSRLALNLPTMPGRGAVYQCVDCLFFFTDCTTDSPSSCEAAKCKFLIENGGKHELVMHYRPLYHEAKSEAAREERSKTPRVKKRDMQDKMSGLMEKLNEDPELAAEFSRLMRGGE